MSIAFAVAALAAAGVGAASTPAKYRVQTSAICRTTSARLSKVAVPKSVQDINRFLKASLPIFRTQWKALKEVDPPRTYRFLHLKVLSLEKQQLDGIESLIGQIDGGADPAEAFGRMDAQLGPVSDAETAVWKKLGVPTCADV